MITKIELENFYSFGLTEIPLNSDINLLIGINGSGKSNFLKALRLLKEGLAGVGLKKYILETLGGFDNMFFKGHKTNDEQVITLRFYLQGEAVTRHAGSQPFKFHDNLLYQIQILRSAGLTNFYLKESLSTDKGFSFLDFNSGSGFLLEKRSGHQPVRYDDFDPQDLALREISDSNRYPALTTIKKALREIAVYDYFDTTPKSLIRKPMLPSSDKKLAADGTNLPQILNTLKINDKASYRRILDMLKEVNPNFTDIDFNLIGGNIELMLEESQLNSSVHVSNISDGTLRYLCLLAILYNPERGAVICIDEPEVGLHPDMVVHVANGLRFAAEKSLLLISTHSEDLLNLFEIEHVRVFEKDGANSTQVQTYTKAQFEGWYEEFFLGKMWKMGDLGGLRYGS